MFIAFVTTFLATRGITRLIRAGKGPFRNLSSGGPSAPLDARDDPAGHGGILRGRRQRAGTDQLSGAAFVGIGASLVLDEFAMIFHLQDVYWSQEVSSRSMS